MIAIDRGAWRGFCIALIVSIVLPALVAWIAFARQDFPFGEMLLYTLVPALSGAYPFSAAANLPVWLGIALSVLQMTVLSAVFGWYSRRFRAGEQFAGAAIALGLLSTLGWIACLLLGVDVATSPYG
jgi:ABC-type uncharacterized transport system permease subunit